MAEIVTLGGYYQTKQDFNFQNGFVFNSGPISITQDGKLDMPENLGLGIANTALMDGGMFRDSEQLGEFTSTSIASYWLGGGLTWRFGRGASGGTGAADQCCNAAAQH